MLEENLKRVFTILHTKWTDIILAKMGGDSKYEAIERDQDVIGMLKLIKGVMFKSDKKKELTHAMWKAYVSVFWCRQHKFETNQEYFERFKNATRVMTKHDG